MARTQPEFMELIQANHIQLIYLKLVDINGQYRHVTLPAEFDRYFNL